MASRTEVEIDGNTFFIKKFEPFKSVKVLGHLQKSLLGPAGSLVSFSGDPAKNNGLQADLSEFAVERAIEKVSRELDGETLERLAKMLIDKEYVSVVLAGSDSDKPAPATEGNLNLAFEDDPFGGILMLFIECIKVNYLAFFMRAQTLFGRGQTPETKTE